LKYMALGGRILLLPVLKKYGVVRVCAELMWHGKIRWWAVVVSKVFEPYGSEICRSAERLDDVKPQDEL
jgi:hypothetical protein